MVSQDHYYWYRYCQHMALARPTMADGTPSNRLRTGHPPIFDDAEKQQLVDFVTRDA